MPVYKIARCRVRPEVRADAERAMHEFASYVRKELPDASWTIYRDPQAPSHYVAMIRTDDPAANQRLRDSSGSQAFHAALRPLLDGEIELTECELVTSSDLQRRLQPDQARRRRSRR